MRELQEQGDAPAGAATADQAEVRVDAKGSDVRGSTLRAPRRRGRSAGAPPAGGVSVDFADPRSFAGRVGAAAQRTMSAAGARSCWISRVAHAALVTSAQVVACLAALIAIAALSSPAAAEDRHRYSFDVNWSMFPDATLARGVMEMGERDGRYAFELDAEAKIALPPIDWRGTLETIGWRTDAGLKPLRFERESIRPDLQEKAVVAWNGGAAPSTTVVHTPSGAAPRREPVDPEHIRDAVDPLTFMAMIYDRIVKTGGQSCDVRGKTWDGVRLAFIETETDASVKLARVDCRVIYHAISGLRPDTQFRVNEESTRRILRFKRVEGEWRPIFLRIDADLVMGVRTTFTTNFRKIDG